MSTLSVIIPTFNRRDQVLRAIASVDEQTCRVDEIIVVDDGSTDATTEALISRQHDEMLPPLRIIRQENAGPAAARNAALRVARGDLVAFLDDDDVWHPDKVARQLETFAADTELALLACSSDTLNFPGKLGVRRVGVWLLLWRNVFLTPCVVARRDVVLECGGFPEGLRHCEDYALWLRIVSQFKCGFLDEVLVSCGNGKPSFGHSGLSADLDGLHNGEIEALRRWRLATGSGPATYWSARLLAFLRHWRRHIVAGSRG